MEADSTLGPYRLDARIGRGGMGEVWAATGPDGPVAIKIIPDFLAWDSALGERFRREAEAIRRLDHPGVVKLIDFGEEQGRAYLVMELLEGGSLADRLAGEGALPLAEVEPLARGLAEALAYVHAQGIIHRDLKPDNIFITPDGGVKLIDLGVAKVLDEASLTMTGSHFGTPAYMSPESFQDAKRVTAATDIWSFGVILYQATTGQLPFPGKSAVSIITRISDTNITPQAPNLLRDDLPRKLAELIALCLARDPEGRPTAVELVHQLGGIIPPAAQARDGAAAGCSRRAKIGAFIGCGLIIALLIGGAGALWYYAADIMDALHIWLPLQPVAVPVPAAPQPQRVRPAAPALATDTPPIFTVTGDAPPAFARLQPRAAGPFIPFRLADTLPIGSHPYGLVVQDLNGDGAADLTAVSSSRAAGTVYLNDGAGGFGEGINFSTDTQPTDLQAGDFDGDGHPDLVVTSLCADSFTVLFGRGDGSFDAPATGATRARCRLLTMGDIDGDGRDDIILTQATGLQVCRGNAARRVTQLQPLRAEPVPDDGLLADLDGDGLVDLAGVNYYARDRLTVFLNQGAGELQETASYPVGDALASFPAAGDLNGDGAIDIVSTNRGSYDISILLNRGDGSFADQQVIGTGRTPTAAAIADLNGDNRNDLVVACWSAHHFNIFLARGDGPFALPDCWDPERLQVTPGARTLAPAQNFGLSSRENSAPDQVAVADLARDGSPELITLAWGTNDIRVYSLLPPTAPDGLKTIPLIFAVEPVAEIGYPRSSMSYRMLLNGRARFPYYGRDRAAALRRVDDDTFILHIDRNGNGTPLDERGAASYSPGGPGRRESRNRPQWERIPISDERMPYNISAFWTRNKNQPYTLTLTRAFAWTAAAVNPSGQRIEVRVFDDDADGFISTGDAWLVRRAGDNAMPPPNRLPYAYEPITLQDWTYRLQADANGEVTLLAWPGRDGIEVAANAASAATGTAASESLPHNTPVNINTATAEELTALPGIGPATAARIIADRQANGPFRTVDDLTRVQGIGPRTLAGLRPYVTVEQPPS